MNVIEGDKLTIAEVCQHLYVSRSTLNRWMMVGVRGKRLPSLKIGGKRLLLREDVEAFIEREGADVPPVSRSKPHKDRLSRSEAASRELDRLWGIKR